MRHALEALGLVIGVYDNMDLLWRGGANSRRVHSCRFHQWNIIRRPAPSVALAQAASLHADALDELCRKHGTRAHAFHELKAH